MPTFEGVHTATAITSAADADGDLTFACTVPAGANLAVICWGVGAPSGDGGGSAQAITAMTFNGVACVDSGLVIHENGSSNGFIEVWYIENPASGNLVITSPANGTDLLCNVVYYSAAGTPIGFVSATGSTGPYTINKTAQATAIAAAFYGAGAPAFVSAGTYNRTKRFGGDLNSNSAGGNIGYQDMVGTGSAAALTQTPSTGDWWAAIAFEIPAVVVVNGHLQLEDASGNYQLEDGSGALVSEDFTSSTTPVGKDLGLLWDTKAAVGKSVQALWNTRAAIGKDLGLPWNVRIPVGKEFQALWNVRQAVGKSVQALWSVKAPIGKDLQALWNTRVAVGDPLQIIWNTRTFTGKDLQALWNVRAPVGDEIALLWNTRQAVGDPLQLLWNTRVSVGDPLSLVWNVRQAVGKSSQFLWNTKAPIGKSVQFLWDVQVIGITAVGKNLSLVWNTKQAVGDPLDLRWNTRITAAKALGLVWNVRALAADDLALRWNTRATVARDLQLLWNTRAIVSDTLDLRWGVRSTVGLSRSFLWEVRETAGKSLVLLWNVEGTDFDPVSDPESSIRRNKAAATILVNTDQGNVITRLIVMVETNKAEASLWQ